VNRLGGTVGLDSQLGKYTEFTVDLPFAGTLVDVEAVSARLGKTTLLLVEPAKVYDYSFSEYQILPEPGAFDSTVVEIYGLDVVRCQSVDQAVQEMKKRTSEDKNRHFAFLIDEKLFYSGIPDQLESIVDPSQFTLMTVGPHYSIPLTKDWHFKSLLNFFPAALLDTIHSHIETQRDAWYSDGTELSPVIAPSAPPEANVRLPMKFEPDSIPQESNQDKSDLTKSSSHQGSLNPIPSDSLIPGGLFSSLKSGGDFAPTANTLSKVDRVPVGLFASLHPEKDFNGVSRSRSAGSMNSDPLQEGRKKIEPSSRTSLPHAQGQNSNKPPPPPPGASPRFGQKTVDGLFGSLVAAESPDAKVDSLSSSHRSNWSASAGSNSNQSLQDASTKVQGQRTTSKAKQSQKERDLRVLYCEDNSINQKVLSRHLTRAGVKEIVIVDNGQKGVDLCEKESFDIIFMDYEMPVMDGMEATKLIVERDPDAVVIFVTAHALEKFKSKAEAVGASGFFSKPFKATDIESVLDLVADKKTTRTRNGLVPPAMVESNASTFSGPSPPSSLSPPPPPPDVSPISPRSPPGQSTADPNLPSRSPKQHASTRSLKILMAEDNVVNQKVLSRVLNRAGVSDITIVDNGQKAVDLCRTVKFDAIFSDVEMPVMGGLEACKQIVAHDPQALVVFVTAHTQAEFEPQANAVGGWGFLPKPFRLADVNAVLDRLEVACQQFPATASTITTARSAAHAVSSTDAANQEAKMDHPETFLKLTSISSEASFSTSTVSRNSSSAHSSHSRRGIRRGSATGTATGRSFPLPEQSTMKVLYAEDNLVNQKVLARVLNRAGISDITVVDDGQKAVDICAKESFDVIFMDVQMPVLDGIAACKVIVERDPSAVVVFVTAHALDEFKMQAQSIGAQNFISKPFRLDDIKKVLSQLSGIQ
jgi:CheY-like chemotaxis protein